MYKRIFRSVCLTAFAVFIASLALIMGMLYQYFDGQLKEEIRTEANYLAHAVNISGEEYLTELSPGDKRITLIGADGTVLYDSEADPDTMDNHSQRDEVVAARKYGLGESVRDLAHLRVHAGSGDHGFTAAVYHGGAHVDHVLAVA